jgi:hypothetical protein
VTGEIVGLAASGQSAATAIFIDSVPGNFTPPAPPYDLLTGSFNVHANTLVTEKSLMQILSLGML